MILDESNIKAAIGTVSPKSALTDPHIQKLLKYVAKQKGIPEKTIQDHLAAELKEYEDLEKKAPILYFSIVQNAIEAAVFGMFEDTVEHMLSPKQVLKREMELKDSPLAGTKKLKKEAKAPEFDPVTFGKLLRRVKAENPSFFPLRNFFNKKPITAPRIIFTPAKSKEDEKWNSVNTAAATPQGEFIFNIPFMQHCMNYAHVRGTPPKGKKYESNGGEFPDEWAMIEFLIMHEFFHYTHADFHYQKVLKANPKIINWVGDFRSNYDLIKMGMEPIPMGLYNDKVNYDRQMTYKEMYDIVKSEFDKLNPPDQKRVDKGMDGAGGDDHTPHHGDEEPGEGGTTGGGDGTAPTPEELEEHGKKVSKKSGERTEGAAPKPDDAGADGKSGPGGPGGRGSGVDIPTGVDWKSIRPRYPWKDLLARLVKGDDQTEVTYQKVHRRNITGIHVATQTGAGVIRPGEKVVPAQLVKLCLVIDSSGSMSEAIKAVFANINKLFGENSAGLSKTFALVEFSSSYHMYKCTIQGGGQGTAREISSVKEMSGGGGGGGIELSTVLSRHAGGATNFTDALAAELKGFMAQKYNVIIMTDSDIGASGNFETFMNLYQHNRQQTYLLLDSHATFTSMAKRMSGASANISHF